jgi:sulfur carrier protein
MISLNGQDCDLRAGETVDAVLGRLDLPPDARGVAIAVDGQVVPRARWAYFSLPEHACVEVLTAMQGG